MRGSGEAQLTLHRTLMPVSFCPTTTNVSATGAPERRVAGITTGCSNGCWTPKTTPVTVLVVDHYDSVRTDLRLRF
jgi:hypothetical protein